MVMKHYVFGMGVLYVMNAGRMAQSIRGKSWGVKHHRMVLQRPFVKGWLGRCLESFSSGSSFSYAYSQRRCLRYLGGRFLRRKRLRMRTAI